MLDIAERSAGKVRLSPGTLYGAIKQMLEDDLRDATDPLTFVSGCVVLTVAGLTASVIPALRAVRVDPVVALRAT